MTEGAFILLETLAFRVAREVLAFDAAITEVSVAARKVAPARQRGRRDGRRALHRHARVVRRAYLSLGSNVGDRRAHLADAIERVTDGDAYRLSGVYETEPVGGVSQDDFWNLVVELETEATPRELLERARRAETAAGRTRGVRFGPRTLDVDVLLVGEETSDDPEILVPHPRLYERNFVLVPLRELAPELVDATQLELAVGTVRELGTLESLR